MSIILYFLFIEEMSILIPKHILVPRMPGQTNNTYEALKRDFNMR